MAADPKQAMTDEKPGALEGLLSCPFCGADEGSLNVARMMAPMYVGCLTCGTLGPGDADTPEAATENWNRRALRAADRPAPPDRKALADEALQLAMDFHAEGGARTIYESLRQALERLASAPLSGRTSPQHDEQPVEKQVAEAAWLIAERYCCSCPEDYVLGMHESAHAPDCGAPIAVSEMLAGPLKTLLRALGELYGTTQKEPDGVLGGEERSKG